WCAPVALLHQNADTRRRGMLLDVGKRLRHLPEDDGLDLVRLIFGKLELDVAFDPAHGSHTRHPGPDGLLASPPHLERLRLPLEEQLAQGLLGLIEQPPGVDYRWLLPSD